MDHTTDVRFNKILNFSHEIITLVNNTIIKYVDIIFSTVNTSPSLLVDRKTLNEIYTFNIR